MKLQSMTSRTLDGFLFLLSLVLIVSFFHVFAVPHFEGFEYEEDELLDETLSRHGFDGIGVSSSLSESYPIKSTDRNPKFESSSARNEEEFAGLPHHNPAHKTLDINFTAGLETVKKEEDTEDNKVMLPNRQSYVVEILCISFLVAFVINYFRGKRENENIALSWAAAFATKDSIFDKNFSLLGVGEGGDDSALLLKEGQNVFKFYASGRRYCSGILGTMELKSRHDLISRLYNLIVPCKDEISFEVYMNDDSMDHIVLAVARKKMAKMMLKEFPDLQRFGAVMGKFIGEKKWVSEKLMVVSEIKSVAGDLITDTMIEQVLGTKAFESHGGGFLSLHFSDQHAGTHKKMLSFKFVMPEASNMAQMTHLVALIPCFIDLVGRYKLGANARAKAEAARLRVEQEAMKQEQLARQEALQKKQVEKKLMEKATEAKLSLKALRKKEAKENARRMRKTSKLMISHSR